MQRIAGFPGMLNRITKKAAFPGFILIIVACIAVAWANSAAGGFYFELWQHKITFRVNQ